MKTNKSINRIASVLAIFGVFGLLLSGCNQSQIDDLKKRISSTDSNGTTANNNTTANANVNTNEPGNINTAANGNANRNGNTVASETDANNQAGNTASKNELNIDAFFGEYLGFDEVTYSGTNNVGKYNLTSPAVVSRVDGETVKITNFGGFASFINAKIKPDGDSSSASGVSVIDVTDPDGRIFKGTIKFKITGTYRVTRTRITRMTLPTLNIGDNLIAKRYVGEEV